MPAVRALLRRGLSEQFLRSCVRIGGYEPFGGGFKSRLVGGLRIDVNAVLKLGDRELVAMAALVDRVDPHGRRPGRTAAAGSGLRAGRVGALAAAGARTGRLRPAPRAGPRPARARRHGAGGP